MAEKPYEVWSPDPVLSLAGARSTTKTRDVSTSREFPCLSSYPSMISGYSNAFFKAHICLFYHLSLINIYKPSFRKAKTKTNTKSSFTQAQANTNANTRARHTKRMNQTRDVASEYNSGSIQEKKIIIKAIRSWKPSIGHKRKVKSGI